MYLGDAKIGRMFKDMYGKTVPDPVIAILGAAVGYSRFFCISLY